MTFPTRAAATFLAALLMPIARAEPGNPPNRGELTKLATDGQIPAVRRRALAAIVASDGALERTWSAALQSPRMLQDLLRATPLITDPKLREQLYAKALPLLTSLPPELAQKVKPGKETSARYVRIDLFGPNRTLNLAEVQVFSDGENIAPAGAARQSSTAPGGAAAKAIDGNTSADFADGGQSLTQENQTSPWWELDLRTEQPIDSVVVWNSGGEPGKRIEGFKISLYDGVRRSVFVQPGNPVPEPSARFDFPRDEASDIRRTAIDAISRIGGHEAQTFTALASLIRNRADCVAAAGAIRRIPHEQWPRQEAVELARSLISYATSVPPEDRATGDFAAVVSLARELTALFLQGEADKAKATLEALVIQPVVLRPVPLVMAWEQYAYTVEAGRPVEVTLDNVDLMPHNFALLTPGSAEAVGMAAEELVKQPGGGFDKQFIPDDPAVKDKILHHTKLVQPLQSEKLQFTAPTTPGDYPFICSFPLHYKTMTGTLHVVAKK